MIRGFHLLCRFCGNGDIEVSFRPAVIALVAAGVMNDLNTMGNGGHIPKDGFQASDAVGVHGGYVRSVCICPSDLYREHRQNLHPIDRLPGHGDGVVAVRCLQFLQPLVVLIIDLCHRSGDRHNARLPALVGKKDTEGGRHDCRHKDHRQEQHQHHRTAACGQEGIDRRCHTPAHGLYRLHRCSTQLLCGISAVLYRILKHRPLCFSLRRPCAVRDDCIVRRCVVSWSNTHGARDLGHGLSALWGRTALDRCALIAFMRRGRCASTVGRWRYNVPLRCSFLGKVSPIGGFRVLRSFLPPTLLRGSICTFCASAILRRNSPVSDFISCGV